MITTIVLKILLIIIAVIVILLHFSVVIYVSGSTSGQFVIRAKYLGITLYPRPKKDKKEKKKKRRRKKAKKEDEYIPDEILDETEELSETDNVLDEDISLSEEKPQDAVTSAENAVEESIPEEEETAEELTNEDSLPEEKPKVGRKRRKKKEKRRKEKQEKEESSEEDKKEGKLDELKRKWEFIKPYLPPAWKYSKKLLKAIRIEDVKINIATGKEDAAESATFYGKLQAALFNTLNLLAMMFTLKISEANVRCLFNEKRLDAEGEANVRIRPSTAIAIAFCLLWCCGKIFIPYKLKQRRTRKKAEKEAKKKALQKNDISAKKAA